jgi:hypothetical protein
MSNDRTRIFGIDAHFLAAFLLLVLAIVLSLVGS